MFRLAFIAYLSLIAALGPALCCCSLRHVQAGAGQSTCCGHSAGHGHVHRHKHGEHAHSHTGIDPHSTSAPADSSSLPPNHDGQDCPCGRQREIALAVDVGAKILESHRFSSFEFFVALPIQPVLNPIQATTIPSVKPAMLAGREMLRAYQIMRC